MAILTRHILKNRKVILSIFMIFFLMVTVYANTDIYNVIRDPSTSTRCQSLIQKRALKVSHKNKIWSLMLKNRQLQKYSTSHRGTLQARLKLNLGSLRREYSYVEKRITKMTEHIIKSGCPAPQILEK